MRSGKRVLEVGTTAGEVPFLAMERLRGHDLAHQLRRKRRLELSGVGYRRWYGDGAHLHPHTMALPRDQVLPITEELSRTLIGMPMSVDLSAEDISLIGEAVREVFA